MLVERQLGLDLEIAALIVAEERFGPLASPFDRPADQARRPGEHCIFRVEEIARAEIPTHVMAQYANLLGRYA